MISTRSHSGNFLKFKNNLRKHVSRVQVRQRERERESDFAVCSFDIFNTYVLLNKERPT